MSKDETEDEPKKKKNVGEKAVKWMQTHQKMGLVVAAVIGLIIYVLFRFKSNNTDIDQMGRRPKPSLVNSLTEDIDSTVFDPSKPNALKIIGSIFTLTTLMEEIFEEGLERLIRKLHSLLQPGGKIAELPGVTTVLKMTYKTLKAAPKTIYTLLTAPAAAAAGVSATLSSVSMSLAGAGFRLYVQTGALVHSFFTTSLASKLTVQNMKFLLGASLGPLMWAVQLISTAGMILDFYDPNKENDRIDFSDINERATNIETRQAYLARLNGHAWPPIAPIQRLFPEEHDQAMEDVFEIYKNKLIDHTLNHPEDDDAMTTFALQTALNIPDKTVNEALASDPDARRSVGSNTNEIKDKFMATINEMMQKSPEFKDSLFYSSLVRHITENGTRDFKNAKAAPFWYFALSIPTAFYTGALDTSDIPPMKRGITYNNLTVMDIKVTEERVKYGETFIDIYRAKSPYFEERVRAYLIKQGDVKEDDLSEVAVPNMPEIASISQNGTAIYRRYEKTKFEDNMIFQLFSNIGTDEVKEVGPKMYDHEKKFGFRDEPASKYDGRAQNNAHSRWLAMCCFQQFLLELAQHPGVLIDTKSAAGKGGSIERVRGVFRWKGKLYKAFAPRPWHEPRFISADLRFSRSEDGSNSTSVFLNEAAAFRWNEVFEHQRVAGSVLTDLRGVPADEAPYIPVAVWTDDYPDVQTPLDTAPTPPQTRLIDNLKNVVDVEKTNGRIVFTRPAEVRIARVVKKSDFDALLNAARANGIDEATISKNMLQIFGLDDEEKASRTSIVVAISFDAASSSVFLQQSIDGEAYVICNRNFHGQNTWVKKSDKLFQSANDVKDWPDMSEARERAMQNKDFKKRMRNIKRTDFFVNANLSSKTLGGVFDVEVEVKDSVTEKVWAHVAGPPHDRGRFVHTLQPGEDQALTVDIYKLNDVLNKDTQRRETVYFVNHDGGLDSTALPDQIRRKLSEKRMLFLPVEEAYLYATKGMQNDDSMMRGSSKDGELARKCGIFENYNVSNKSGVPHAMLEKKESSAGCAKLSTPISFADYYDRDAFSNDYIRLAFTTFHNGRVVVLSNEKSKANIFCRAFKGGAVYKTIKSAGRDARGNLVEYGRCQVPWYQAMWEFLLGSTITKAIGRSLPI